MAADNAEIIAAMPEAGDIPNRLAVSFSRLVTASARAHDRAVATEEDVEEGRRFLAAKLDYLKFAVAAPEEPLPRSGLERMSASIIERFGNGQPFDAEDLLALHREVTGDEASERSARRWIDDLGAKRVGKGKYVLRRHDYDE